MVKVQKECLANVATIMMAREMLKTYQIGTQLQLLLQAVTRFLDGFLNPMSHYCQEWAKKWVRPDVHCVWDFSSWFLLKRYQYLMNQWQLNREKEHTCKAFSSRARWLLSNSWMWVHIVVLLGMSDFLRSSRSIMKMPCSRSDSNTLNDYKSWLTKDSKS